MKILYKFTIFLLILLWNFDVSAQNEQRKQVKLADSLFNSGNYFDAVTEYKRLAFFDARKEYLYIANYRIAECYKAGARFSDAVKYYRIASQRAASKDDRFAAYAGAARAYMLDRKPQQALDVLLGMKNEFPEKQAEIDYWKGWAYMFLSDWENASREFKNSDAFLSAYADSVAGAVYSPETAKVLSMLPGAGQIYTGNYLDAAISLGWNALWGYTSITAFLDDRVLDGLLVSGLLWFRFYRGGIENAGSNAVEKNEIINIEALNHLQKTFTGAKP
jgi:hypothetical protein